MSQLAIQVENLSKRYQLGTIGYGSLQHDLRAWWAKTRGKEDPNTRIGEKSRLDLHGEFWALRGVSFEVQQGDRVGIIGRNGAGKSTLLKLLSRVTSPTTGRIKVRGRIASLLEVGTGFHPELTGRENVFLNGAILGMKRREIQNKFDEVVDFAGVSQFIDTPVKRYSSGMYVRLAFSVAAHLDSETLIVDEVLTVGDANFQLKCIRKLEELSLQQGRTILVVSHQIATLQRLCNKGLLLESGQLRETEAEIQAVLKVYTAAREIHGLSDLSSVEERSGNGLLRFKSVEFFSSDDRARQTLVCGEATTVRIFFENPSQKFIDNLVVCFKIKGIDGLPIIEFCNYHTDETLSVGAKERPFAECRIPQFPLQEGQYGLELYVGSLGEAFDWIPDAGQFTVSPGNFFGSWKHPQKEWFVLAEHSWRSGE